MEIHREVRRCSGILDKQQGPNFLFAEELRTLFHYECSIGIIEQLLHLRHLLEEPYLPRSRMDRHSDRHSLNLIQVGPDSLGEQLRIVQPRK